MRRLLAASGLALAVFAAAVPLVAMPSATTEAASAGGSTFVIPANDGYGIADCVGSKSSCGQVVADAWCEAQGFARSASFGPADVETTGSIGTAGQPISVTCSE